MRTGIDLSGIYNLRTNFVVIGITGRTGTGCTEIAQQLGRGFDNGKNFPSPNEYDITHDAYKKYKIVYNYAKENFKPFTVINYKDVLSFFILLEEIDPLVQFLKSDQLKEEFKRNNLMTMCDYSAEISELQKVELLYEDLHQEVSAIYDRKNKKTLDLEKLHELFFEDDKFVGTNNNR
jgi:hypothetical protein